MAKKEGGGPRRKKVSKGNPSLTTTGFRAKNRTGKRITGGSPETKIEKQK